MLSRYIKACTAFVNKYGSEATINNQKAVNEAYEARVHTAEEAIKEAIIESVVENTVEEMSPEEAKAKATQLKRDVAATIRQTKQELGMLVFAHKKDELLKDLAELQEIQRLYKTLSDIEVVKHAANLVLKSEEGTN